MNPTCFFLLLLTFFATSYKLQAQSITNGDGTPLTTKYCPVDQAYLLDGQPSGGTFSGCGISQENGQWYFNPLAASQGITVFPYSCSITYTLNNGTALSRNLLVWKPVIINPPLKDSFTCNGRICLNAQTLYAGDYLYQWTPAAWLNDPDSNVTDGFITSSQSFLLSVTDVTSGCTGPDSLRIERYPSPQITVSNDTTILARETVPLQASGADRYLWTPVRWLDNDTVANPVASPQAPVTYQVIGLNEFGCMDTASVTIDIREHIFIPNAFSPNSDGLNDVFKIENFGYQAIMEFRIYNRWGQCVFQTMDGLKGWDGTQNGQPVEAGSYFYQIRLQQRQEPVTVYKGSLMLLR